MSRSESGIGFSRTSTLQNDSALRFFKGTVVDRLGSHRAKGCLSVRMPGGATGESDSDLLVVVDQVNPAVTREMDAIAGQALLEHGAVLSAFPIVV